MDRRSRARRVLPPDGEVLKRHTELPGATRIVAVCRVGGRSTVVTEALQGLGYDAVNLAGGMRAWLAAGLVVEDEHGRPGTVI